MRFCDFVVARREPRQPVDHTDARLEAVVEIPQRVAVRIIDVLRGEDLDVATDGVKFDFVESGMHVARVSSHRLLRFDLCDNAECVACRSHRFEAFAAA